MLVVVENRDVESLAQLLFNLKTAGRRNIFKVDSTEAGGDQLHGAHDFIDILGVKADRPCINIGKFFKESRFSFHDGHGSFRSNISQTENSGSVGDHGNGISFNREIPGVSRVFRDRHADPSDTGGVGARQICAVAKGYLE